LTDGRLGATLEGHHPPRQSRERRENHVTAPENTMAKALLGQYVRSDDRLIWEAARLRDRVQDLQGVVRSLQDENDRLRAELETRRVADEMAIRLDQVDLDRVDLAATS